MNNNQILAEISLKLRRIADELEHCSKTDTSMDSLPQAGDLPSETTTEPAPEAGILPPAQSVSERIRARVENYDEVRSRNVGCSTKIPSCLVLRLRLLFAANPTIRKGDWYTCAIRRHLAACVSKTGKELSSMLQHVQSREREPKMVFITPELHARLRSFLALHNISFTRFLCSAMQREIEACERINNGPFLI